MNVNPGEVYAVLINGTTPRAFYDITVVCDKLGEYPDCLYQGLGAMNNQANGWHITPESLPFMRREP